MSTNFPEKSKEVASATHVHVLVELSTVDELEGGRDLVVGEVLLDGLLVDASDDYEEAMRAMSDEPRNVDASICCDSDHLGDTYSCRGQ